jgi:hypothetical protein
VFLRDGKLLQQSARPTLREVEQGLQAMTARAGGEQADPS